MNKQIFSMQCLDCEEFLALIELKCSVVELLDLLLEQTSSLSVTIKNELQESLDHNSLMKTLSYFKEMSGHKLVKAEQMDDNVENAKFQAYHILLYVGAKPDEKESKGLK